MKHLGCASKNKAETLMRLLPPLNKINIIWVLWGQFHHWEIHSLQDLLNFAHTGAVHEYYKLLCKVCVCMCVHAWQLSEAKHITCWIVPSVLQPLQSRHQRFTYLLSGAGHLVIQVGKDPFRKGESGVVTSSDMPKEYNNSFFEVKSTGADSGQHIFY